ncbi:MAG: T9SS type A sorting domain-containing protein [Bacteroidetes bacterium]|nr:T9SS type A sorting domain-containing protein [Bacteroidota bacterium]
MFLKHSLFSTILLSYTFCLAQQKEYDGNVVEYKTNCESYFLSHKSEAGIKEKSCANFLKNHLPNLKDYRSDVALNYSKNSLTGIHFSFHQTFLGTEIYQSEIKINVNKNGIIKSIFDNSVDTKDWTNDIVSNHAVNVITTYNGNPVPGIQTIESNFERIRDTDGYLLYERDTRSYAIPDSQVTGNIFHPDPLTTAQVAYGNPYFDNANATNASLNSQMQQVPFIASFDGLNFKLENQFVRIQELDLPTAAPATSSTPFFLFNRSQDGFEDVNAFYHINEFQKYVSQLGFDIANGLIDVDTHGFNGSDNSYFSPTANPQQLIFGTGGVDDAEDADVIIHEYGHFLSESAAPGSNVGHERKSLDEGFCDYLCAAYSKSLSSFDNLNVYNWDGHNEFWNGRVVSTNRVYPTNLSPSSIYRNGEMWSTALFKLRNEIGRAATDSLLFEAQYSYAQNIAMDDAAYLLVQADTALFNGKYYCSIYKNMLEQGFLPFYQGNPCGISSIGNPNEEFNLGYIQKGNSFTLFNPELNSLTLNIYDLAGTSIKSIHFHESVFEHSDESISRGLYFVEVSDGNKHHTFKWMNY